MSWYHGSSYKNLQIDPNHRSRYGVPAMFFSNNIHLAKKYAVQAFHHGGEGYLYQAELSGLFRSVDYQFGVSYSRDFRNMILKEIKSQSSGLIIENVLDRPSKKVGEYLPCSIAVVFELDFVKSIICLGSVNFL